MLRVATMFGAGQRVRTDSATAELWSELGYPGLESIIRAICTRCGWDHVNPQRGQLLGVSSAISGEGKSLLAEALAISMARDHASPVLLLECDLVHPTLSEDFGLQGGSGLCQALLGLTDLDSSLRLSSIPNLWLLPAGTLVPNPSRLLRSPAMAQLLEEARQRFAFIILDLPAVLQTSDAAVLAHETDGVVLIARAGRTPQGLVQDAIKMLGAATVHGVVLNHWRSTLPGAVRRILEL